MDAAPVPHQPMNPEERAMLERAAGREFKSDEEAQLFWRRLQTEGSLFRYVEERDASNRRAA